uniref:MADS-box transcription factor 50 n=1 Tax=Brachypodium distachyon TaxID=15368 RepID=I1I269_BRADI|nr:MADS-box transcription factor 50 [Brachypodium distachyon]
MVKGKTTKGRQKIEIKAIHSEKARHVCFSKRRQGLFGKANELSTLCGAGVAIVVFSPGGKIFSFGNPSVDSIIHRFLPKSINDAHAMVGGSNQIHVDPNNLRALSQEYSNLQMVMEAEQKRKKRIQEEMEEMERESEGRVMRWLNTDVTALRLEELEEFHGELTALECMVNGRLYWLLQQAKKMKKTLPQFHGKETSTAQFMSPFKNVMPMSSTPFSSTNGQFIISRL